MFLILKTNKCFNYVLNYEALHILLYITDIKEKALKSEDLLNENRNVYLVGNIKRLWIDNGKLIFNTSEWARAAEFFKNRSLEGQKKL